MRYAISPTHSCSTASAFAIAPALGIVRERYGNAFLSLVLSAVPLAMTVLEPRDMIKRQRALIDYVHQ